MLQNFRRTLTHAMTGQIHRVCNRIVVEIPQFPEFNIGAPIPPFYAQSATRNPRVLVREIFFFHGGEQLTGEGSDPFALYIRRMQQVM
jgi:hypothetical protein